MLDPDACYEQLSRRDPRADGVFFVAVRSTRIYCRPICPARTPFRENVTFFTTVAAAQSAGYRPCLRCRPESAPDSPAWAGTLSTINRALHLIDDGFLTRGSIEELADRLGMTSRHLRRLFERHVGAPPASVEQTRRVNLAKKLLHETSLPITEIAFAAGFGSVRRFNESFQVMFGRPPSALRRDRGRSDIGSRLLLSMTISAHADRSVVEVGKILSLSDLAPSAEAEFMMAVDRRWLVEFRAVPLDQLGRAIARVRRLLAVGSDSPIVSGFARHSMRLSDMSCTSASRLIGSDRRTVGQCCQATDRPNAGSTEY